MSVALFFFQVLVVAGHVVLASLYLSKGRWGEALLALVVGSVFATLFAGPIL